MKEASNKKAPFPVAVIGVAIIFMIGAVYAFLGGFVMSLIIGLTDLPQETLALIRYIVSQIVNAAWFITVIVMVIKWSLDSTDGDDD